MSDVNKAKYTSEQLSRMTNEELARLGTELDDVNVVFRKERFPQAPFAEHGGDPAEQRSVNLVGFWLILGVVCAIAFIGVYLFWPHEYRTVNESGLWWYTLYTPMLGITMGLSILSIGFGAVIYTKRFVPEEISVQRRHDGPSAEVDQKTISALLNDSWKTSTLGRRKVLMGLMGTGVALAGLSILLPVGGMVRNPWKAGPMGITGDGTLWTTGWSLADHTRMDGNPEKIYLGRDTGAIAVEHHGHYTTQGVSRLVRVRPEDLSAGSMETVFPLRAAEVNDGDLYESTAEVYEGHMHSIHGSRNAVMLIRLRPDDAAKAVEREGQESFKYGDFYAYSKICTHIGCPTSLYEAQTNRILCPCHQSQFDALHYGKPIFGPAARALPQLPITVDEEGYLYAAGDFIESVGPAFWERKS